MPARMTHETSTWIYLDRNADRDRDHSDHRCGHDSWYDNYKMNANEASAVQSIRAIQPDGNYLSVGLRGIRRVGWRTSAGRTRAQNPAENRVSARHRVLAGPA